MTEDFKWNKIRFWKRVNIIRKGKSQRWFSAENLKENFSTREKIGWKEVERKR